MLSLSSARADVSMHVGTEDIAGGVLGAGLSFLCPRKIQERKKEKKKEKKIFKRLLKALKRDFKEALKSSLKDLFCLSSLGLAEQGHGELMAVLSPRSIGRHSGGQNHLEA